MKRYFIIFFTALDKHKNRVWGEHPDCGETYPNRAMVIRDIHVDGRGYFKIQITDIKELSREDFLSYTGLPLKTEKVNPYPVKMPYAD